MKKLFALLLAALMIIGVLASCGGNKSTTVDSLTSDDETSATSPSSTSDSVSDSASVSDTATESDTATVSESDTEPPYQGPTYDGVDVSNVTSVPLGQIYVSGGVLKTFEHYNGAYDASVGYAINFNFPNSGKIGETDDFWGLKFMEERANLTIMVNIKDPTTGEWKLYNGGSLSNEDGTAKEWICSASIGGTNLVRIEIVPREIWEHVVDNALSAADAAAYAWANGHYFYPSAENYTGVTVRVELWNADKTAVVYRFDDVKDGIDRAANIENTLADDNFKADNSRPDGASIYDGDIIYDKMVGVVGEDNSKPVQEYSANDQIATLFDGKVTTKMLLRSTYQSGPYMAFDTIYVYFNTLEAVTVKGFSWVSGNDAAGERFPLGISLECSTDGATWTAVGDKVDGTHVNDAVYTETYFSASANTVSATQYRIVIEVVPLLDDSSNRYLQASEFWLWK